jgi:hypothetical protein
VRAIGRKRSTTILPRLGRAIGAVTCSETAPPAGVSRGPRRVQ